MEKPSFWRTVDEVVLTHIGYDFMKVQSTKPQLVAFQIIFKQLTQLFFNNKQRNKLKSNQIKSKKLNVKNGVSIEYLLFLCGSHEHRKSPPIIIGLQRIFR